MQNEPHPDPNSPHCHGTGVVTVNTPFLDRVEEETVTCRCVLASANDGARASETT